MEFFVSGRFKKVVREQRDNPWDWVRYGQKKVKNTRLRYHGGLSSGFSLTPACIPRLVIERVVHYGITLTRLSDRKSTRLNSSHLGISYAVFCLKKKKKN